MKYRSTPYGFLQERGTGRLTNSLLGGGNRIVNGHGRDTLFRLRADGSVRPTWDDNPFSKWGWDAYSNRFTRK